MISLSTKVITSFLGVVTFSKSIEGNERKVNRHFIVLLLLTLLTYFGFPFFSLFAPYVGINKAQNSA